MVITIVAVAGQVSNWSNSGQKMVKTWSNNDKMVICCRASFKRSNWSKMEWSTECQTMVEQRSKHGRNEHIARCFLACIGVHAAQRALCSLIVCVYVCFCSTRHSNHLARSISRILCVCVVVCNTRHSEHHAGLHLKQPSEHCARCQFGCMCVWVLVCSTSHSEHLARCISVPVHSSEHCAR